MRIAATSLFLLLLCGCGGAPHGALVVRVRGTSTSGPSSASCFLLLHQHVVGGGRTTYCLQRLTGRPGPNATLRDSGVMMFALPDRRIRARVHIVARFAADGRHAKQTLAGTVDGGGRIAGGGPYVEDPPGHVANSDLHYVISR
jgi:hypothetical protein